MTARNAHDMMDSNVSTKYSRALHLLSQKPPSSCRVENIDFAQVGLPVYTNHFAILIHDALSVEECQALVDAAEENNQWEQALINVGGGAQALSTDVRMCHRILWDNSEIAAKILDRTLPYLPSNVKMLKDSAVITGNYPILKKQTLQISRLNERLRFLKYTPGCYFRPHCDAHYSTPDTQETTYLTLHLYLNGGETETEESWRKANQDVKMPLLGGATRFLGYNMRDFWDLHPKAGTILVFQHRNLLHSGEGVLQGTKYTMRSDILYRDVSMGVR